MNCAIGLDFATEGARLILINEQCEILNRFETKLAKVNIGENNSRTQDVKSWITALDYLISEAASFIKNKSLNPVGMTITATSGTFVLCDNKGNAITDGVMYNDGTADSPINRAKLLGHPGTFFKHVPEYLIAYLTKDLDIPADWSHSLKTGFDLNKKRWLNNYEFIMPNVVAPGEELGTVHKSFDIGNIPIYAGMTDGCTGQISAGGTSVGSAVTTIGTTLVTKLISDKNISGPGFYSHLLPDSIWLAGGASNLGGISLRKFEDLDSMNKLAAENGPSNRVVYPLIGKGERFPISDKEFVEVSTASPESDIDEFRSILEGIAFAERLSYEILKESGGPKISLMNTVGGGSKSFLWSQIRATVLNMNVISRPTAGSDLGAAMIALASWMKGDLGKNLERMPLQNGTVVEPNASEKDKLENNYQKFLKLIHHSHKDQ